MHTEAFVVIGAVFAFICILASVLIIRRVRGQIAEMVEILEDVKSGNGNRRILSETHELTAPLAYELNDIILSYERRLCACHQMEETNRQLMTSLSHDIRTPLTTLIGYLDAAQKGIVTGKERDDYIETACRKAHDLKEYIDVLFDWFRLGSDEFTLNMTTVDLTDLTRSILICWVPVLENARIDFTIDIPEQPFPARLDPDGYTRIINNLMQNVLSHSQADKIRISLTEQESSREDSSSPTRRAGRVLPWQQTSSYAPAHKKQQMSGFADHPLFIKIVVADNGIGIEKEDLKHIFERLYKCDRGRSEKGSGLGLSIARQLAEKMGGTITAESTPGKGCAFTLLFPLVK